MAKRKGRSVGVIGLGSMGLGVARTLVKKGFQVHAHDVRPQVVKAFEKEGGIAAANPGEVGANASVLIILVVNADQTDEVLFGRNGAAPRMARGSVVIASATVAPAYAEELGQRLAQHGIYLIDAPVSGGAARAATGQLSIMASGNKIAFRNARQALDAIAAKVYRLGEYPGMGSKVKMINQLLAGVHIAAACEAMALGIRAGRRSKRAVRGHLQQRGLLVDVPEPRATHPGGRLHAAVGGEHLREGSRHRAGLGQEADLSPADHRDRASDVSHGRRRGARHRG